MWESALQAPQEREVEGCGQLAHPLLRKAGDSWKDGTSALLSDLLEPLHSQPFPLAEGQEEGTVHVGEEKDR